MKILLKNCRLVPELTEGYDLSTADVLIIGNKIEQIKPCNYDFNLENETKTIDLNGRTLLPGFIEMHTHLCYYTYNANQIAGQQEGTNLLYAYEFAKEYLNQGYTTVRDAGTIHNIVVNLRDAINRGTLIGPRLISSGLILTPTETGNDTFNDLYSECDGSLEIQKAVRLELQKGNDFIKYMASGAFMNLGGDPGAQICTEEELKSLVEAAKLKNTYVAAHAHGAESIRTCIKAGVRTIEHGTFIDDESIEALLESNQTFIVPTAGISFYGQDPKNKFKIGESGLSNEYIEKNIKYSEAGKRSINNAYNAGLKLGFGSDLDLVAIRNRLGYEFTSRKEYYTFKDIDILLQATKNSAEICGIDHLVGTIKEGKLADLVIVNGNPDENINILEKPVDHVIRDGVLFR